MADSKRKRSRPGIKLEDPIQQFTNQIQQQSIAIYGFPLALQLLAYRNISGLLDQIPGSADERTFLEWHSIGIPKSNLTINDVHLLERVPDMTVILKLFVNTNEDGWGEWDDEEPVVEHKKHIVIRKRKLSPTSSSKGTPSKTKVSTSTRGRKRNFEMVDDDEVEDNDDEAKDIKLWVKSQLSSIRHEFAESVKKLRSQNLNLLKKIRVLQSVKSYRSRPCTRHPSKKDETPSMKTCKDSVDSPQKHLHLPSPRPPAVFDTATKPSPNDVTEDDKKEDDQKDDDQKEDDEIESDDEEVEFPGAHLECWTRMKGIYVNERSGDCGPVSMKLIEIYATGGNAEKMALITDEIVTEFREDEDGRYNPPKLFFLLLRQVENKWIGLTNFKFNNFTSFNNILEGTFDIDLLFDLVGAIVEVGILSHSGDPDVGVEGMIVPFKLMDRYKEVLDCEATGRKALEFDTCYRRYGHPKIVLALAWWRVVREPELVGGRKNKLKIVSYGAVSSVYPEPSIEEVEEIKMVRAHLRFTRMDDI
ncbi:Ulp1 protease family C-terminal catalytic domain [Arabidopsis suecica]|uniref:Ulp1 protease family C-terminal catalytic domain n=1 Tax=Arabidopsis suecica TaxID=45249 RepID=A0A8T1XFY2_ARASU|nr:Ulp1 protease family C-terminal catalytic domain [Arabidopsis suecica]